MAETTTRCSAETPNPFGNQKGVCTCALPEGHDGLHSCQAERPHQWAQDNDTPEATS